MLWQGGGANSASDKVVQHNGRGTVTIKDTTFVGVGKVYRSCGDCTLVSSSKTIILSTTPNNHSSNNGGPRNVVISNIKVNGVSSDLVGINSNYGDTATVSNSCGVSKKVCQEYKGVTKGSGSSAKVSTTANCKGAQGQLSKLPTC